MKKLVLLGLVVLMALSVTACGKKCEACGKRSGDGAEIFGKFVCQDCLENPFG